MRVFENIRIIAPGDGEQDTAARWGVCCFGGSTQNQTQSSAPWTAQQPYLEAGFSQAQNLLNGGSGNYVAPFTPQEQQALQGIYSKAGNDPFTSAASNFSTNLMNGKYLENPATDQMAKTVMSQVVPSIQSQFVKGGGMNNPAAAYATAQGATSALAPVEYQNYQQGLDEMTRGLALAPQTQQMQYGDLDKLFQAGQLQQQQNQQVTSAPWNMLNQYMAEIGGNYGGTVTTPYYSNPFGEALGAGAGIMSLLGPLMMMSDDRLKETIELQHRRPDGLGIYRFRYKWRPETYEGVLASEVERTYPEAVSTVCGLRCVNYGRIGAEMRMVA